MVADQSPVKDSGTWTVSLARLCQVLKTKAKTCKISTKNKEICFTVIQDELAAYLIFTENDSYKCMSSDKKLSVCHSLLHCQITLSNNPT